RRKLYVESARVSGLGHGKVVFGHVLPNLAGPLAVQGAVFLGSAIKVEAALSFLGLGLGDDKPSWGGMLGVAAQHQADHPLMAVAPGIAIIVTVLAFNLLGDGINDAFCGGRPTRRRTRLLGRVRPAGNGPTLAEVRAARTEHGAPASPAAVLEVRDVHIVADG